MRKSKRIGLAAFAGFAVVASTVVMAEQSVTVEGTTWTCSNQCNVTFSGSSYTVSDCCGGQVLVTFRNRREIG